MHKTISKYNHETSIVSAIFSFCAFLCKNFVDKLLQSLDYLSLMK